jgi:predicted MFS family arabinose efflux permease
MNESARDPGALKRFAARIARASVFIAAIACLAMFWEDFPVFGRPDIVKIESPALALKAGNALYAVDSSRKRLIRARDSGGGFTADLLITAGKGRFSEISDIAADVSGDIFVLDAIRDANRRIKSEAVRRYSSDGKFVEEIFRAEHEPPAFNRTIAGLARNAEPGCFFITLEDGRFTLFRTRNLGNPGAVSEFTHDFGAAPQMFNFFDVGEDGFVLFTTKRGEIYRADAGGIERLFASRAPKDGGDGAIPWDAAVGDDGAFYFTDLGRRGVYLLNGDGSSDPVYADPDTIYYRVSAQNGLMAVSGGEVIDLSGGEKFVLTELKLAFPIIAKRVCAWLAVLILLAYGAWAAFSFTRFLIRKNNFVIRFSAAVIAGIMFITAMFCLIVTKDITNRMTREMLQRLTSVAELLALQIPGESFVRLDSIDDTMNEDYAAVRDSIEKVIISRDDYASMYCVLYREIDGAIAEVFESENDHGIVNYPYDWPLEGSDEMEILAAGEGKTYVYPSWVDGGVIFSLCPIYGDAGEPTGLIEIGTDLAGFRKENRNLILNLFLNVISVSVAMIIVAVEFLMFAEGRRKMAEAAALGKPRVPVEIMRCAVFLVYFISNISTSFLPVYARGLILGKGISPAFGLEALPAEFLIAAPISADVLMGVIASLLGNWSVEKFGTRRAAVFAGLMVVAGIWLECFSSAILTLTAGFAVSGFGCGFILFLADLHIARVEDVSEKERGFAGTTAAMTSGINGGVVFGAFLLNWLSYRMVLGVAAAVSLTLLAFSVKYMTKVSMPALMKKDSEANLGHFLLSPKILLYMAALLGPMIASGYFIIYLFPIVGYDLGISESNIGYAFLLNSLTILFFSSSLTEIFSRKLGKPFSLTLWSLVYAGSFAAFAFFQNIPALLAGLVLMGFADSFGHSLSASYYTELPEVEKYGYGRAIAVSNVVNNAAQTIGPFVFGYALHVGLRRGLLQIAAGLAALSLIFLGTTIILDATGGEKKRGNVNAG